MGDNVQATQMQNLDQWKEKGSLEIEGEQYRRSKFLSKNMKNPQLLFQA